MSPQIFQQMSIQQQEKVIAVTQAQVEAKTKEVDALKIFQEHAPAAVSNLAGHVDPDPEDLPTAQQRALYHATEQYFSAKHAQALMELEQLQLTVTALKSMQSPIVGARFNRG